MKQAELYNDGYPTDETIKIIKNWPIPKPLDYKPLLEFIRPIFEEYGEIKTFDNGFTSIVTGGWSGCEEAISTLMISKSMFWGVCWECSKRGGYYEFDFK